MLKIKKGFSKFLAVVCSLAMTLTFAAIPSSAFEEETISYPLWREIKYNAEITVYVEITSNVTLTVPTGMTLKSIVDYGATSSENSPNLVAGQTKSLTAGGYDLTFKIDYDYYDYADNPSFLYAIITNITGGVVESFSLINYYPSHTEIRGIETDSSGVDVLNEIDASSGLPNPKTFINDALASNKSVIVTFQKAPWGLILHGGTTELLNGLSADGKTDYRVWFDLSSESSVSSLTLTTSMEHEWYSMDITVSDNNNNGENKTPSGYNDNDYQKLVAFALQGDNQSKLGWTDLQNPASWNGVTWTWGTSDRQVLSINITGKDLEGKLDVSGCAALGMLECGYNELTSLNVLGCVALESLGCKVNNQLISLNVSQCKALKYLRCSGGKLTNLIISQNPSLTTLDCSYAQLQSLDVSGCTALTELNCNINNLTSLDVSNCVTLTQLWCQNNQLTSLDVSKNTKLKKLNCWYNQLTKLDVSGCAELTMLSCVNNQLTSLDVSNCVALTQLWCESNQFTTLNVSNNTALEELTFSFNELTNLDVSKNTKLKFLDCSLNQLTKLDVSKNTKLEFLGCINNQLTSLDVSNCVVLTQLWCDSNQLTTLDVSKNTALKSLTCRDNRLTTLDVSKNTALTDLYCSANRLTSISSLNNLNNLCDVDVSSNNLNLSSPDVKTSISLIQATINKNKANDIGYNYGFIYEPQNATTGGGPKSGDLNGNGKIDPLEISMAIDQYRAGDLTNLTILDINGDGKITPLDISMMIDMYRAQ